VYLGKVGDALVLRDNDGERVYIILKINSWATTTATTTTTSSTTTTNIFVYLGEVGDAFVLRNDDGERVYENTRVNPTGLAYFSGYPVYENTHNIRVNPPKYAKPVVLMLLVLAPTTTTTTRNKFVYLGEVGALIVL